MEGREISEATVVVIFPQEHSMCASLAYDKIRLQVVALSSQRILCSPVRLRRFPPCVSAVSCLELPLTCECDQPVDFKTAVAQWKDCCARLASCEVAPTDSGTRRLSTHMPHASDRPSYHQWFGSQRPEALQLSRVHGWLKNDPHLPGGLLEGVVRPWKNCRDSLQLTILCYWTASQYRLLLDSLLEALEFARADSAPDTADEIILSTVLKLAVRCRDVSRTC